MGPSCYIEYRGIRNRTIKGFYCSGQVANSFKVMTLYHYSYQCSLALGLRFHIWHALLFGTTVHCVLFIMCIGMWCKQRAFLMWVGFQSQIHVIKPFNQHYRQLCTLKITIAFAYIMRIVVGIVTENWIEISMGCRKKDVTPLLTHWSYVFLAPAHRYGFCINASPCMPPFVLIHLGHWQWPCWPASMSVTTYCRGHFKHCKTSNIRHPGRQ